MSDMAEHPDLAEVGQRVCEHDWVPAVEAAGRGLAIGWTCAVCGASSYEPSVRDR